MATAVYNDSEIEESIENSGTVSSNVSSIIDATSTFLNSMDKRIKEYYPEAFDKISTQNTYLNDNVGNVDSFRTWLSDTYNDYTDTNAAVNDLANDASTYTGDSSLDSTATGDGDAAAVTTSSIVGGLESVVGGQGSADGVENYYIDPELWADLPGSEKTAIETKLKEVGYSDAEILQIKNGELPVDKTKLESLSSELEELYKKDPTIRQTIIDLYGFDIFNDDGTVDKTKLALLMLIDDKNTSDKYDVSSLISELNKTSTASTSSTTTNTTSGTGTVSTVENSKVDGTVASTSVTGAVNSNSSSSIHSGSSYSGNDTSTLSSTEESLLDSFVDSSDDSISDIITNSSKTSLGAVAATAGGKAIDTVKSSAVGAIPVIAGIGSTLATAGGLTMAVKKKEKDKDDDNLDDDDELFNENKNDSQKIDSIKPEDKDKNDKEWLYGLGIGLAGAGAGIAYANKDKDEDDDNDNEKNG
jgi:hypothetical protein